MSRSTNPQLKTIRGGDMGALFSYTYDVNGNVTQRLCNRFGSSTVAEYDQLARPTLWEHRDNGGVAFARSEYDYDLVSRQVATWRAFEGNKGERFGYDAFGQLTSAVYNADNVRTPNPINATRSVSYNLDALNRIGANAVNDNGALTAYTPNAVNQYTSVGGQAPGYTANLSLSQLNGSTYSYDSEKRLTGVSGNGQSAQFIYDGLNRCVKRTLNGVATLFTYDGWNPILEWDSAGNFASWNIYGFRADEILWRHSGYGHFIYQQQPNGSVSSLSDPLGNRVEKYTYDAFGQPTVTDGNGANARTSSNYGNRFMFTGREWLSQLGLYDYRNRFYQPQLGRFLQPDPIGFAAGDANLFRYCAGDPVNFTDPDGRFANFAIGFAVGAGIDLGVQLWQNGGNFGAVNKTQVFVNGLVGSTGVGLSAVIGRTVVGTTGTAVAGRIALNAGAGFATAIPAQVGINASNGQPLGNNVVTAAFLSGGLGAVGSSLAEFGQAWASALANSAFDAASIEQKLLASSNAISGFVRNASLLPGIGEAAGTALSNSSPVLELFRNGPGGGEGGHFGSGLGNSNISLLGATDVNGNSLFGSFFGFGFNVSTSQGAADAYFRSRGVKIR